MSDASLTSRFVPSAVRSSGFASPFPLRFPQARPQRTEGVPNRRASRRRLELTECYEVGEVGDSVCKCSICAAPKDDGSRVGGEYLSQSSRIDARKTMTRIAKRRSRRLRRFRAGNFRSDVAAGDPAVP